MCFGLSDTPFSTRYLQRSSVTLPRHAGGKSWLHDDVLNSEREAVPGSQSEGASALVHATSDATADSPTLSMALSQSQSQSLSQLLDVSPAAIMLMSSDAVAGVVVAAAVAQHAQHAQHTQHARTESEAGERGTAGGKRRGQRKPSSAPARRELTVADIEEAGLVRDRIASNRFWGLSVTDLRCLQGSRSLGSRFLNSA